MNPPPLTRQGHLLDKEGGLAWTKGEGVWRWRQAHEEKCFEEEKEKIADAHGWKTEWKTPPLKMWRAWHLRRAVSTSGGPTGRPNLQLAVQPADTTAESNHRASDRTPVGGWGEHKGTGSQNRRRYKGKKPFGM